MVYPEPMFNASYGAGLEGFINYSNVLVDGWVSILFLAFIFIASLVTFSKSEWSTPSTVSFSFFICLISAFILKLFTAVNEVLIFIIIICLGLSVGWGILAKHGR